MEYVFEHRANSNQDYATFDSSGVKLSTGNSHLTLLSPPFHKQKILDISLTLQNLKKKQITYLSIVILNIYDAKPDCLHSLL